LEVEADLVGARLLAYAGFDARTAVKFWEEREAKDSCAEAQRKAKSIDVNSPDERSAEPGLLSRVTDWLSFGRETLREGTYFEKVKGAERGVHPISAERVKKLRTELERWDLERARYLLALAKEQNSQVATT
ncbi:hypothetical protein FRC20_007040, partial [Serendipita sp. 405]